MTRVVVFGAGGAVGEAIAHALIDRGETVVAAMRRYNPDAAARLARRGAQLANADLTRPEDVARAASGCAAAIAAPILSTSARAAPVLVEAGVKRLVFLSSNNVSIDADNLTYAALLRGETYVRSAAANATIVRPTLIYGDPALETLPRLIRLMRKTPVALVPGRGSALEQPVHHEDLARVCAAGASDAVLEGLTIALGGPEIMSRRAMYAQVSRAAGGIRAIAPLPRPMLRLAAKFAALPLDSAQIERSNANKIAVAADPLPERLAPITPFAEGLKRLVARMEA